MINAFCGGFSSDENVKCAIIFVTGVSFVIPTPLVMRRFPIPVAGSNDRGGAIPKYFALRIDGF